jgi:hypothetical protein
MRAALLLLTAALVTLPFAGCLSENTPDAVKERNARAKAAATLAAGPDFAAVLADGTLPDPSMLLGLPALAGEQRFIGARTFEPTLGIDKKGNIYMVAFGGGAKIRGSFDQGATWKQVNPNLLPVNHPVSNQPVNNPPNSNDPFVWVDKETGRIFTNDLQALVCSWMNYSDDEGKTWVTNPIGCGHPFGVHDHQSITTGKARATPSTWAGRMVYYCINRVGDSSCASSNNGGLSFGPLIPVMPGLDVESGRLCGGLTGHAKTDSVGRVFWGKNQCGVPTVAVTEDDGRTWRVTPITKSIGARGHDIEIAVDEKDNVYAFWLSETGLPTLSISKDAGKTWSKPIMVGKPGVTAGKFNAIAAGGEGKIAFTYLGRAFNGTVWHAYIGVVTNALAENPLVLTTMVDSPEDPVAIHSCAGRCDGMGDFMDIQIDNLGRPWAALVDVCNDKCSQDFAKDPLSARHDANMGFVGTLATGPSLLAAGGALPALPPVPAVKV